MRHTPLSLDGGYKGSLLAAYKGAGSLLDMELEVLAGTQDVVSQKVPLLGGINCYLKTLESQRVFGTAVDIAFVGPGCPGPYQHTLDDAVGISLQNGPVHECTWVTFVRVADQVFLIPFCPLQKCPFLACQEAGAATPLEARFLKQVYYIITAHGQGFLYPLVATCGNVFIYVLRIYFSAVLKSYLDLRSHKAFGSLILKDAVCLRQSAAFYSIKKLFCKGYIHLAECCLYAGCHNLYNRFLETDSDT